jgi:hypothetical protein
MRRDAVPSYVRVDDIGTRTRRTPMGNHVIEAMIDAPTVERLSSGLNRCFETYEAEPDLFVEDAFFDLRPPEWRLQLQGPGPFVEQLRAIAVAPSTARVLRVAPTPTGFVMEHVETQHTPDPVTAHRLLWCEVRDGRITEVSVYCNGGWDDALRARHAAEAPMIRP